MNKEEKQTKIFYRIAIPIVLFLIILGVFFNFEIKRNAVFTNGKILSYTLATGKSPGYFNYEYEYKNKLFKSNQSISVHSVRKFFGKSFPVVVSSYTGRSEILVTPAHFKRFYLPFPDSLNWVKEYIEKW
jgi:uncharacterized membrane protein YkgB